MNNSDKGHFCYRAFGLEIESELAFPQLLSVACGDFPDLTISFGQVPDHLDNSIKKSVTYEVSDEAFLLDLQGVARFYVELGSMIRIEPKPEALESDIRHFLLGTCIGAALHQRKILPLHASAVDFKGKAILFTGISGAGKSSVANAFRMRGHMLLTDDICPIQFNNDIPYAIPAYPQSKLWEDALDQYKIAYHDLPLIRPSIKKRALPLHNQFKAEKLPICAMYVLAVSNVADVEISPVVDANKFTTINLMIYRKFLLVGKNAIKENFLNVTLLASLVPIIAVFRPYEYPIESLREKISLDITKRGY